MLRDKMFGDTLRPLEASPINILLLSDEEEGPQRPGLVPDLP